MFLFYLRRRDVNRKKAAQLLREGNRSGARECLQKSIDITAEMALQVMKVVSILNILTFSCTTCKTFL